MLWLMFVTEIVMVALLIALFSFTVVALMLATGTTSPVDAAVDTAWDSGNLRAEVLENAQNRYCQKHASSLGSCYTFYTAADLAVKRPQPRCPNTMTSMATNCSKAVECLVARQACILCDEECKLTFKAEVSANMRPATWAVFIIL